MNDQNTNNPGQAMVRAGEQSLAQTNPMQALTVRFPEDKYNVLAPTVHMDGGLPAGTRLVVTEVKVNPDDCFGLPGGALLVGKVSLDRISNASGISWVEETRKDDRSHPYYVEMFVRGKITDFDGTVRYVTGSKSTDLREDAGGGIPGKDFAAMKTGAQIREARKFILEITATKAKNRAISSGVGMERGFSKERLAKPFVIPKLALDTRDPQAREIAMASAAGATDMLFAAKAAQTKVVDAEFEDTTAAEVPTPASAGGGGDDEDPPEDKKTGEVRSAAETSLRASLNEYMRAGGKKGNFKALFEKATGKTSSAGMTDDDAANVVSAVKAYIANKGKAEEADPDGIDF